MLSIAKDTVTVTTRHGNTGCPNEAIPVTTDVWYKTSDTETAPVSGEIGPFATVLSRHGDLYGTVKKVT